MEVQSENEKISLLLNGLLKNLNYRDSKNHDVILLQFGSHQAAENEVKDAFDAISKAIPKENVLITLRKDKNVKFRKIKKAAVIIVVSDYFDSVS